MEELENKFIELLLKKCLNFDKSKSLFIDYNKENREFIKKVIALANKMGVYDICLDEEDINVTHEKLSKLSLEEIEKDPYFDKSKWNEYALKDASFLIFLTEFPNLMNDINPEKISKSEFIKRKTRNIFRDKELAYQIPWCISALPTQMWANDLFPNDKDAYEKLFKYICEMCLVDEKDPIQNWGEYLKAMEKRINKLNSLKIKNLHYKNKLGTDLEISMPNECNWLGASEHIKDKMLVNMPSYEIFSTPDFRKTNGIVYSSLPLIYNGGLIEDFYFVFKDGKIVNYGAKTGKDIIKGIIESEEQASYLGEVALVDHDSPISKAKIVSGNALFDENASCHLALGNGFPHCVKNASNLSKEEQLKLGVNKSTTHVDFMIGTDDLDIEAETEKGKTFVFKNGNFNKEL